MADKSKSPKKGSITEEDAASLIQRYSVWTVVTLLQEVERVAGDKIDWDELVKNTETGISCAREYQMLWRHLAYGSTLEDQLDSDAEPLARILFRLISLLYMTSMAVACVGDVHWFFYFLTLIEFGLIHMLALGCNLAMRIVENTNGYWPLLSNLFWYWFSFTNNFVF